MGIAEKLSSIQVPKIFGRGHDNDGEDERGISGGLQTPQSGSSRRSRGGGRAWARFDSDGESAETVNYVLRGLQAFFLLICIFINVALTTFQEKHEVGVSGLVVLTYIVAFSSLATASVLALIPYVHERTSRFHGLARGVKQIRPAFLLNGSQALLLLIMAFVLTISSNVKGCKDVEADANADKEGYTDALPGFCATKRALTAFLWFAFFAWLASLTIGLINWRRTRSSGEIPGFIPPDTDEFKGDMEDEEERVGGAGSLAEQYEGGTPYSSLPASELLESIQYQPSVASSPGYLPGGFAATAAARQSGTFYEGGRPFDAPTPTGFSANPYGPPSYEDPYERIRRERMG